MGTGNKPTRLPVSQRHQHREEIQGSIWSMIATYFGYGVLIFFGHLRDYLRKWCGPGTNRAPEGYAPLARDFEDFYTRRMYHRIQDCWNRPIASCPGAWIDLVDRKRAPQGSNIPPIPLKTTTRVVNIGSYNYLGFGDPDSPTKGQVFEALQHYSVGSCAPRSTVGTTVIHRELEEVVARFVGKDDALVFGMGFGTNAGTIPTLVGKGGLIISDATNHASIVVGARTSGASVKVFKHNDPDDLEAVIRRSILDGQPRTHRPWSKIMIIIEGIYSMEGELPPLQEIVRIKKKYGCYLYVDEAHSIGALGKTGRGICEETGVATSDVDILMGTFTKAFGSVGGYIAADTNTIAYLRQTNYAVLNASPLSPPACQQVIAALGIMMGDDGTDLGQTKLRALNENSNYFRYKAKQMGLHVLGDWGSPISPILLYNPAKIAAFSREMLDHKVACVVVGYPATPLLLSRSRFCISAAHTKADLDIVLAALAVVSQKITIRYAGRAPIAVVDAPEDVISLLSRPSDQWACYHRIQKTDVVPRGAFVDQTLLSSPKTIEALIDEQKYGGDILVSEE